jgi:hypothetical protein
LINFFDLLFVKFRFFNPLVWWLRIASLRCLGCCPADVLSAFARSRCKQRVFFSLQSLVWRWRLHVFLSLVAFPVHFQVPVDDKLWKEEKTKMLFIVILFCLRVVVC